MTRLCNLLARCAASSLLVLWASVVAHPIEYHMEPLSAETVERVVKSLDMLLADLERTGAIAALRADPDPERRIPIWRMQAVIAAATGGSTVGSPAIRDAVLQAGYQDGPFVVEEWQLDADRVLDVYDALKNGTSVGDPSNDHKADYKMVSRYLEELDVRARTVLGQ